MLSDLELTSADVQVCGEECGSDPLSIAKYAVARGQAEDGVDHVYCVFDRDSHTTKPQALALLTKEGRRPPPSFTVIESVPCFEYWLLLHVEETAKPYAAEGSKSVCDTCIADLKKHPIFEKYAKGSEGLYVALNDRIDVALERARRRRNAAFAEGTDMPTTDLPSLIQKLRELSPRLIREAKKKADEEAAAEA